jgi:hypothetical protein
MDYQIPGVFQSVGYRPGHDGTNYIVRYGFCLLPGFDVSDHAFGCYYHAAPVALMHLSFALLQIYDCDFYPL